MSRSSRPLPALSPHAVAHAGFSAGPHAPEAAVGRLLHAAVPNRGVPGSTAPAARHRELLDLPWGALCRTPASPQTLRARGEGGGQARGARDSARPETGPAGGAEGGGGHRRSYSGITRSSQLGPAPRSLSLTCLTPPRPGPAPFLPLGVPAPRPPAAPGAHVTDGTAPRAGPGFLIGFSQGAYRPSAPPSQVPALRSVSPGEPPGIMRLQPPRLRTQQSLPLPEPHPGPGPALWGGPLGPLRNRLAQSRQARDLGVPRPRGLRPTIGCGGACAKRRISWPHPLPLPQSLARVMAAATALEEAAAPMGALCGLVQDFVMGQQEGPADQVAAGMASSAARLLQGPNRRERPQHGRAAGRE